jgi:translocation and assembly module TamB
MLRRVLLIFAGLCAVFIAVMAALPWWQESVLRRVGASWGASFGKYERMGITRFALNSVDVQCARVRVRVSRIEADTAIVFLWRTWTGRPDEISIGNWTVAIEGRKPGEKALSTSAANGWVPLRARLLRIAKELDRWAPCVKTGAGELKWPGGGLSLASARWTGRTLSVADMTLGTAIRTTMLSFPADSDVLRLTARLQEADSLVVLESRGTGVHGSLAAYGQTAVLNGDFGKSGWMPRTAMLRADDWKLPGSKLKLDDLYATLSGCLNIKWSDGRYDADLAVIGVPIAAKAAPPLEGTLRGHGDLQTFTLEALHATLPGIVAELSNPVTVDLKGKLQQGGARFHVQAELDKFPWLSAKGQMNGEAELMAGAAQAPTLHFNLVARELILGDVAIGAASAKGLLEWRGMRLIHTGNAQAEGVKLLGLNPLAVAITWRGGGTGIEAFTAEAKAGLSRIHAAGSATRSSLRLSGLTLEQGETRNLVLMAPVNIDWNTGLQVDSLRLEGSGDASGRISWGKSGRIELVLHRMASSWFDGFVALPGPKWQLNMLAVSGVWDRGPLVFSLSGDAAIDLGDGHTALLSLAARGDKNGLSVETLRATEGEAPIFAATGRLPLVFIPGEVPLYRFEPEGAFLIKADTGMNTQFWEKLAQLTGIELKEPRASAHFGGTWAQPLGELRVNAARIALDPLRFKRSLPVFESLELALTGNRQGIQLEALSVSVEGQALRAQGRLTMGGDGWEQLRTGPLAFIRSRAWLHIEMPDAELAAFIRFLPPFLAPKGRLKFDLNYAGNRGMEGSLGLHEASSSPLGPLGVLQEINADLRISGRSVELVGVTAKTGGQPVVMSGTLQLSEDAEPRYDLALRGENLPFIRQTGLLLRGDLDLKLRTPDHGPALISGTVRLRDSLFLSDVRAFLPGGRKGAARYPPYFSVETTPFKEWTLGVDVIGSRFMRVRTPLFSGLASARFRLSGTLGEPVALGELTVDEGRVLMPFVGFDVKQGSVGINEGNPHELALFLRGTGRRYNYELNIEITGGVEAPSIVFTSSPALDSDQLLLMVTTGASPRDEITYSSTQRFARLGTYLGQSLLGSFGGDATNAERLSIVSGEKVSRQGRETYDIEYKVADRWKWVGEYDEFDDYSIGLKWRFYPGKRKPEAPVDASK